MLMFTTHVTQEKIIVTWFLGIAMNPQITVMSELNELSIYLILNFVYKPPMRWLFFALALTMLGLFCFHHFPKMIVLRRVVAQTRFFPSITSLEMIVLRRVVAHKAVLTMLGFVQNFSYNRSLWNQGLTCIIRKPKTKSYNIKAFIIKDLQGFLGVL